MKRNFISKFKNVATVAPGLLLRLPWTLPNSIIFCLVYHICRDEHQDSILTSMQTIMVVLIEESEDIREDLLHVILSVLGRHKKVSVCVA